MVSVLSGYEYWQVLSRAVECWEGYCPGTSILKLMGDVLCWRGFVQVYLKLMGDVLCSMLWESFCAEGVWLKFVWLTLLIFSSLSWQIAWVGVCSVEVFAVDYGYILKVPESAIYTLPSELRLDQHTRKISLCSLAGKGRVAIWFVSCYVYQTKIFWFS